jgi:hypothetical protein
MKSVISIVLFLASLFLMYVLYLNIQEPIKFQNELTKREDAVIKKLEDVRKAQEFYKDITGRYSKSFDSLKYVLQTDSFSIEKVEGDPDDPTGQEFIRTIIKRSAIDSINKLGLDISNLGHVPFTDNEVFSIDADTMTYQSTLVNVTQVGTRYKAFMGPFASKKYSKYESSYNPDKMLKFGDMNTPNLSGNW